MYVRLAFAVAAHLEPEILLVDEVLAVGDAEFQKKCLGKMGDVAKEGRTVLFVSHNMAAVQQLCGRVILLFEQGRLSQVGAPERVVVDYLNVGEAAEASVFFLEHHKGRPSGFSPIIKLLRLVAPSGHQTSIFYPDERFTAESILEPVGQIALPRITVAVEDAYGRRIMSLGSFAQENECHPIKKLEFVRDARSTHSRSRREGML